jgi:hypothetical protein
MANTMPLSCHTSGTNEAAMTFAWQHHDIRLTVWPVKVLASSRTSMARVILAQLGWHAQRRWLPVTQESPMTDRQKVPNTVLRRVREQERQETRSEFADAMAQKARELGEDVSPSERYVARLEDGDVKYPHPPYRRILIALCGRPLPELGFAPAKSDGRAAAQADDQIHRDYLAARESFATLARPSEIEAIRRSLSEAVADNPMSDTSIEDWERTVLEYGQAARCQRPDVLAANLAFDLTDLRDELARCRSARSMRRLTRVAAQMSGLMCLALVKLDERAAFRRWARTARIAASEAGDPATLAWVRAQEAYGHYYAGSILEAIDVARNAQDIGKGIPSVGAALAAALEARAHARLGPQRREESESALLRAEAILLALDAASTTPSAFSYSEAQLRFHEGSAYTHLRQTPSAWAAQRRALELVPENDYTDRTLIHLDHAICLAQDGDWQGAIARAIEMLGKLAEHQRRGIIDLRARDILDAIPARQQVLPAAREFRDLLMITSRNGEDDEQC